MSAPKGPRRKTAPPAAAAGSSGPPVGSRERIARSYLAMALSHELKQPLNLLNLNVELLSKRLGKAAEPKEIAGPLAAMGTVVERVTDTLEAFTTRVSPPPVEPEPVDIAPVLADAAARVAGLAKKGGVKVAVVHDAGSFPRIPANPEHLAVALEALLENAILASKSGGTVTLRTRTEEDEVFLEVEDKGAGMTSEVLRHAVEIGYSTRESDGVGMTVAKFIAYHHGGGFHVMSTPGQGTTVSIALPVHPD